MKEAKFPNGKTGQEISFDSAQDRQDEIFREMSADQKVTLWAQLWSFGKEIAEGRIHYSFERLERPTLEDLILVKLRWQQISPSSKQLEDVESIFKISGDKLDRKYLARWVVKLGVRDLYSKVETK